MLAINSAVASSPDVSQSAMSPAPTNTGSPLVCSGAAWFSEPQPTTVARTKASDTNIAYGEGSGAKTSRELLRLRALNGQNILSLRFISQTLLSGQYTTTLLAIVQIIHPAA